MNPEELKKKVVIPNERGVLDKKGIYFSSPSAFAREHLFFVLLGAEFTCTFPYQIRRQGLELFLAFRILSGELHFEYENLCFCARQGDIVFLDCQKPHYYYAKDAVCFQFFHFAGNCSQAYVDLLYEKQQKRASLSSPASGALFPADSNACGVFSQILEELSLSQPKEHRLSYLLHTLFGILAAEEEPSYPLCIAQSIAFMQEHYREPVSVDDIGASAALSKYHFSRLFREKTGVSPHEYLSSLRLQHARKLILETSLSVEDIASRCGFSTASHFIRAFKKEMEFTPAAYRKYFDPSGFQKL